MTGNSRWRSGDPSVELFRRLQQPGIGELQRQDLLAQLLALPQGWWGEVPLLTWTLAYSLAVTRLVARRSGISEGGIDWEVAAEEAVLALVDGAPSIEGSPRQWLKGVIWNRIRQVKRERWPELVARELTEDTPSSERPADSDQDDQVADNERERQRLGQYDALLAAISQLPPKLRVVAQLVLIDRYDIQAARAILDLNPAAMRKRLQRMREALRAVLAP